MITEKQLIADVAHEVKSLRLNATKEELERLNLGKIDPASPSRCIYGQMTDSCDSFRAKELMDESCVRVVTEKQFDGVPMSGRLSFEEVKGLKKGKYKGQTWRTKMSSDYNRSYSYLSMLELYISLKGARVDNIIAYLKGESEELDLKLITV